MFKLAFLYMDLYLPVANLSCFQRGVSYSAVKIFNSVPNIVKNLRNDRVQFKSVFM
jgi:hypothetical protein